MDKNERGEEMLQPNQKTVLEKYCVFAPDGLPVMHTIYNTEDESKEAIIESMSGQSLNHYTWKNLLTNGASCQKVTVTIEVNG